MSYGDGQDLGGVGFGSGVPERRSSKGFWTAAFVGTVLLVEGAVVLADSGDAKPCHATLSYEGNATSRIIGPNNEKLMGTASRVGKTVSVAIGEGVFPADFRTTAEISELPKEVRYQLNNDTVMRISMGPNDVMTSCINTSTQK